MNKKLNSYDKHEFLDRSYIISMMVNDYLLEHPAFEKLPENVKQLINEIGDKTAELYQEAGNL